MDRKLALAMAVARLTDMLTLQLADANMTFIIVRIVMIFLFRRIWSKLSLGQGGKVESLTEEALIIMFWRRGGIDFHPVASSFLSSSSSVSFSFAQSDAALIEERISLMSENAFRWELES